MEATNHSSSYIMYNSTHCNSLRKIQSHRFPHWKICLTMGPILSVSLTLSVPMSLCACLASPLAKSNFNLHVIESLLGRIVLQFTPWPILALYFVIYSHLILIYTCNFGSYLPLDARLDFDFALDRFNLDDGWITVALFNLIRLLIWHII